MMDKTFVPFGVFFGYTVAKCSIYLKMYIGPLKYHTYPWLVLKNFQICNLVLWMLLLWVIAMEHTFLNWIESLSSIHSSSLFTSIEPNISCPRTASAYILAFLKSQWPCLLESGPQFWCTQSLSTLNRHVMYISSFLF